VTDSLLFALIVIALVATVVVAIVDSLLLAHWEEHHEPMSPDDIRTLKHLGGPIWVWIRHKLKRSP